MPVLRAHWSVAATVQSADGEVQIGSGVTLDAAHAGRVMRLEGQTVSQTKVGGYISVSWLAPLWMVFLLTAPKPGADFSIDW